MKSYISTSSDYKIVQNDLDAFLKDRKPTFIINILFSTTTINDEIVYSVLLIYKP